MKVLSKTTRTSLGCMLAMGLAILISACGSSNGPSNPGDPGDPGDPGNPGNPGNPGGTTNPDPKTDLRLSFAPTKQFVFEWDAIKNVTRYILKENPDGESGYNIVADNIPGDATQFKLTVPLYQRTKAQYLLEACLPDKPACLPAGETSVAVEDVKHLVNSIGYFKAFEPETNQAPADEFGSSIALSDDGTTLVVSAHSKNTNDQDTTVAYVYYLDSDGTWQEEQRLAAVFQNEETYSRASVSLSADGNTLALGAPFEGNDKDGIVQGAGLNALDPNTYSSSGDSGAVYLYSRHKTGNAAPWQLTAYFKDNTRQSGPAEQQFGELFGYTVSLSADGKTLAVGAPNSDDAVSSSNVAVARGGTVNLYTLVEVTTPGETTTFQWTHQSLLSAKNAATDDAFGYALSLSDDGTLVAISAWGEDSDAKGVYIGDAMPTEVNNNAPDSGAVYLFKRTGVENDEISWTQHAYLKASNSQAGDVFGRALSLSGDGKTLAVGAPYEFGNLSEIINTPGSPRPGDANDTNGYNYAGVVYIFTQSEPVLWQQQAYLKTPNTTPNDVLGTSLSLNQDGTQLITGMIGDYSPTIGLNSDHQNGLREAGAAYYFQRIENNWQTSVYLKASNTGEYDHFGYATAISGDGATIAIGAIDERSKAIGINGDQSNNDAPDSGAVYLY